MSDQSMNQKSTKNAGGKTKGIIAVILLLAASTAVFFLWGIPYMRYSNGNKAFEEGKYFEAEAFYKEAGSFQDAADKAVLSAHAGHYQNGARAFEFGNYTEANEEFTLAGDYEDAAQRATESVWAEHYETAMSYFDAKQLPEALEEFKQSETYQDASEMVKQCNYLLGNQYLKDKKYKTAAKYYGAAKDYSDASDKLMKAAKTLMDNKKYEQAADAYSYADTAKAAKYEAYNRGMVSLSNKKYTDAIKYFKTAGDVKNAPKKLKQSNFKQGVKLFASKKYKEAQSYFKAAGDYKYAKSMVNACKAEQKLANNEFNAAYKLYKKVSSKISVKGCNVAKRRKLVLKYKAFANISGVWASTKNYIETKNVHYSTGLWDSWYIDENDPYQTLEITCILNSKGKMTIKGEVSFYKYSDFSILAKYNTARITYKSFQKKNITKIPSTIKIDKYTKLKYSGGKFRLYYKEKDPYSVYFYNIYRSNITYGKHKSKK